ncbi:hypothetical protein Fot_28870 [Forsythia ovata]|uniref:Uncharacterized protein n=1 Tax=Forsythia ovata TaxID=205694 RepID=A0ABD1TQC4_9LAMI
MSADSAVANGGREENELMGFGKGSGFGGCGEGDDQGKWNWKWCDSQLMDGLQISVKISYKDVYGKVLELCNVHSSLHGLEMRFFVPGDALFAESIQITLDKHVHWYVGLTKQGQHCHICVTRVSKGPTEFSHGAVNDQSNAVKAREIERIMEIETLSFNNSFKKLYNTRIVQISLKLIHNLLIMRIHSENEDELWFGHLRHTTHRAHVLWSIADS